MVATGVVADRGRENGRERAETAKGAKTINGGTETFGQSHGLHRHHVPGTKTEGEGNRGGDHDRGHVPETEIGIGVIAEIATTESEEGNRIKQRRVKRKRQKRERTQRAKRIKQRRICPLSLRRK